MAIETSETGNDLEAHAESYTRFLAWMKWGTVASAIVAVIVVLLIAS